MQDMQKRWQTKGNTMYVAQGIAKMMFNTTMSLNAKFIIKCKECDKERALLKAHQDKWAYKGKLKGDKLNKFICNECYNKEDK